MTEHQTSHEVLARFLQGTPSPMDVLELSSRLAVNLVDVATKFQLIDSELIPRRSLLEQVRGALNDIVQAALGMASPAMRISPVTLLPMAYPELVFPLGYDEVRFGCESIEDVSVSESVAGVLAELEEKAPHDSLMLPIIMMHRTTHYRSPDGMWHNSEGLFDALLPPQEEPGEGERRSNEEWVGILSDRWLDRLTHPEVANHNVLSLPELWVPPSYGDTALHVATKSILRDLSKSKRSLAELHWRTLEEIVAELLHDLGMQVTITDRSGDGGRDVIGRGELIPGEPTLLAVEVKHRRVVPVSEVRQAMWANRHFPALLFVTSGRFSAGVYRERREKEGALRLVLKDGKALSQWIAQYAHRNFWDTV